MTMKEELLFLWLFLVVVSSFLFSHFWSYALYELQKAVALGLLTLLFFSNFAAGIAGIHFFS